MLNLDVVSASNQVESQREAPVPVTVITDEMIRLTGARNLRDVLTWFVPGMTLSQDQDEYNVAMRGVNGSSQQKMLVMLNGHRLNSHVFSSADPDFSISLDKIKQIEVLRGPASSLYGNVALTAVINIITKSGKEINGVTGRAGIGNYGQRTGSILYGTDFNEPGTDLMIWGTVYRATGQPFFIPASKDYSANPMDEYALVDGFQKPVAYDLGMTLKRGDFTLLASRRSGGVTMAFSNVGPTGESYDYTKYRTLNTVGPSIIQQYSHLDLKWDHRFSKAWSAEASIYFDSSQERSVAVLDPSKVSAVGLNWDDQAFGALAFGRYDYDFGPWGAGNLMVGGQVEQSTLLDSSEAVQSGGEWKAFADTSAQKVLIPGTEYSYSGFAQVKHQFAPWVTFNGGARYDLRERYTGPNVQAINPRLAFILTPTRAIDVKLSYAQSFVDAPYWYRYNSLASYRGSVGLRPEHLRSLQLTPTVTLLGGKLRNTVNIYYNHLYDFIYRNNAAVAPAPTYVNAGQLDTTGVEEELAWVENAWHVRANATYQRVLSSANFPTDSSRDRVNNVPNFFANGMLDLNPLYKLTSKTWLNVTARYQSAQTSPIAITFKDATGNVIKSFISPDNQLPSAWFFNVGVHVNDVLLKGLGVDATVYNLFDRQTVQGGSTTHPYPEEGRWFLVNLTYHFDNAKLM